uniref:Secreted protein n=1 Tax=Taenia asiatica TaxID=60517 RepID=A0A0R3WFL7_TAEAS
LRRSDGLRIEQLFGLPAPWCGVPGAAARRWCVSVHCLLARICYRQCRTKITSVMLQFCPTYGNIALFVSLECMWCLHMVNTSKRTVLNHVTRW